MQTDAMLLAGRTHLLVRTHCQAANSACNTQQAAMSSTTWAPPPPSFPLASTEATLSISGSSDAVKASLSGTREQSVDDSQVAQVRALLQPEQQSCDDQTVRRFIRATGGNLQLSAKRLQTTLVWRQKQKPETQVCTACAKNPQSHYMHLVGYDHLRRPIIYSCLENATNKVYQDNLEHMIQTFETAIKCMPPGVEQWVWLCDFHGFGISDVNPKLAKAFLDLSAEHYPERLGLFLLVDAPSLFGVLWKAISGFVDPKTYTKIRFLPYDVKSPKSTLRTFLQEHCDESTTSWLMTEMHENRDKKKVPTKTYSMTHIHRSVSQGDLQPSHVHDLRGEAKLLGHYASSPNVLEPQALHKP